MGTKVVIADNPIKTKDRIDAAGNIIHPKTKQVIKPREDDFVPSAPAPTPEVPTIQAPAVPTAQPLVQAVPPVMDALSVQAQIDIAKDNLKKLEELKALKVKEMEETIKLLKKK